MRRLLGDLDPEDGAQILTLRPELADLEAASATLGGNSGAPPRRGHALAGKAAIIFDIAQTARGGPEGEDNPWPGRT